MEHGILTMIRLFFLNALSPLAFYLLFVLPLMAQQPGTSPVKIFILAGQSNMVGQGNITPVGTQGTLDYIIASEAAEYSFLGDGAGGYTQLDDVWVHYERNGSLLTNDLVAAYPDGNIPVGPEIGFGHYASGQYENQVLIVKCAWGGRDLANDFRPPSSGGTTGFYYTEILRLVNDATDNLATYFPDYDAAGGFEIAGFAWHQGFNDRIDAGRSAEYEANMANFIQDIRTDLNVPGLPFVIATTGMGGELAYTEVELAQLEMANSTKYPDFAGNVAVIDTRAGYDDLQFWFPVDQSPVDQGFHWNRNSKTYVNLGTAMADAMATLAPGRCPSRIRVEGGTSGATVTWQNGTEIPTSVRILRSGSEVEAAASSNPATYLDSTVQPGMHTYELQFTMSGDPCDHLTVTFDGGITELEAFRSPDGVTLNWINNLNYTAIEVRRDGVLLDGALSGDAQSYTDSSPPSGGLVTYTVVPTNGNATPVTADINLDGPPSGNALIYEPFDYPVGGLNGQSGSSEVGFDGSWNANATTLVTAGTLAYSDLSVGGAKLSNFTPGQNRFGGARPIRNSALAGNGLLTDGSTLWFSFITGVEEGANRTNSRLAFALADGPFGSGNADFFISGGTGIGMYMSAGIPRAAFYPADAGGQNTATNNSPQYQVSQFDLVVCKVTWGAAPGDPDTIELFKPTEGLLLPATPFSTHTAVVDQSNYDILTFRRGDKVFLDEIRFGASYDDVVGEGISNEPDHTAPTPDPSTWATLPAETVSGSISMTAVAATDVSGVEYYFEETSGNPGGDDSNWQAAATYVDTGLDPSTTYSYRVRTRDRSTNQNETEWSTIESVTTETSDTEAPTPNPMSFLVAPAAVSATEITMTALTASDVSDVEYYFAETSGNGGGDDSGWQDSPEYRDTGLEPNTTYRYVVRARDKSTNANETASSADASATTLDAPSGPGGALAYEPFDYPVGGLASADGGIGFASPWSSNNTTNVIAGSLNYGALPVQGGAMGNLSRSQNRFGGSREIDLATPGLLADGTEVWFSVLMGYDTGGNRTNSTLMMILGDEAMSGGNFDYNYNTTGATGLGVFLGRTGTSNGTIKAVQIRDTTFGSSGFVGNIYGSGGDTVVVPSSDGTNNVDYRLVVGRITWGVSDDTIDLFLPETDLILGAVHSTLTVDVDQTGFDVITFKRGDKMVMDEIRFGASYEDVIGAGGNTGDYGTWAAGFPLADLSDPDADFDGDGLTNNEERIWGLDPIQGGPSSPITTPVDPITGGFTYQRRDQALSGAAFAYEWSTTLLSDSWTEFTPDSTNTSGTGELETVEVALPTLLFANETLFVRVVASSN